MSFICQSCLKPTANGGKVHRIVTETRQHIHPYRQEANKNQWGESRNDPGGKGTQIVKELMVCGQCLE